MIFVSLQPLTTDMIITVHNMIKKVTTHKIMKRIFFWHALREFWIWQWQTVAKDKNAGGSMGRVSHDRSFPRFAELVKSMMRLLKGRNLKNKFFHFPAKVIKEIYWNFHMEMRINILNYWIYFEIRILINKIFRFLLFKTQVR